MSRSAPILGFVWEQFGHYHMDRCEAVGAHLADPARVIGIEIAPTSDTYDWLPSGPGLAFTKLTLFPGGNATRLGQGRVALRLIRAVRRHRVDRLFVCGYERPAILALASWARLTGRRVIVMNDSKFDDKPRRAWFEATKRLFMLPYHGAFASGRRAAAYFRFQGFAADAVVEGYDTVSLARLRGLAADAPVPAWAARPFLIVARLVAKKNVELALRAYHAYRATAGAAARPLRICGAGPLEPALRALVHDLGVSDHVVFAGSRPQHAIAAELAGAIALLLPSREEQWGLVVNEALAFALPVLVSDNVGARDRLVATLRNGFVLDCDDPAGWAEAMRVVGHDRAMWDRLHAGARAVAPLADTAAFVAGCTRLAGLNAAQP